MSPQITLQTYHSFCPRAKNFLCFKSKWNSYSIDGNFLVQNCIQLCYAIGWWWWPEEPHPLWFAQVRLMIQSWCGRWPLDRSLSTVPAMFYGHETCSRTIETFSFFLEKFHYILCLASFLLVLHKWGRVGEEGGYSNVRVFKRLQIKLLLNLYKFFVLCVFASLLFFLFWKGLKMLSEKH